MSPWLAFTCFRAVSFVYRKSFMQRLATKLRIMVGLAKNNGAYGEYRNIAQSSPNCILAGSHATPQQRFVVPRKYRWI